MLDAGTQLVEVVPSTGYEVATGTIGVVGEQRSADDDQTVILKMRTSVPPQARD
jgi:hypothetical protein